MSQQNDEDAETSKKEAELKSESVSKLESKPVVAGESVPSEVIEAFTGKMAKDKKRISKGLKITLFVVGWLVLACSAVGLAFLLRPKVEIGVAEESFKWSEVENEEEKAELVDVDFYSLYDTNAIEFYYPYGYEYDATINGNSNPNYNSELANVPQIKGLKNEAVQNRINSRIMEVVQELYVPNFNMWVHIGDNMFNVLSLKLSCRDENFKYFYVGLSFDLTTGDELVFDDIFVKGANIESIVYKRFYNALSTSYSFSLLDIERGIRGKEGGACTMWCDPNVSLEEYYSRKEEVENKLANIEEIALNEAKKYLAGEKKFYLESAGPVFIYNDGLSLGEYYAPDDVQYFAYLGKYRTNESIYENESIGLKNVYLSSVNTGNFNFGWIEENDEYFIDFLSNTSDESEKEMTLKVLRDLIKEIISKSDRSKYFYILVNANAKKMENRNLWFVYYDYMRVYEMDKEYFDKVFRKAIFDGKTHRVGAAEPPNPLPKIELENNEHVAIKQLSDYGIERSGFVDEKGNIYNNVENIFLDGVVTRCAVAVDGACMGGDYVTEKDWKDYLINYYYGNAYRWDNGYNGRVNYTDEEKKNHEFRFKFSVDKSIEVEIKDGDGDFMYGTTVKLDEIPNEYLKEIFRRYN